MHDIGDALIRNELISPVLNTEKIILTYNSCQQLMCELKYIGAQNANNGRRKTLTGKNRLKKVFEYYETYRADKKLPATYEVIYGHAWKSPSGQQTQTVTLEEVKQQLKKGQ
jgi:malonyl-CoA O-methyltransferase